nr:RecName: Full=26 kDa protein [Bacillus cereus]
MKLIAKTRILNTLVFSAAGK